MDRAPGASVRLKLALSYVGFLMIAGVGLVAVVWVFLLRYVPDKAIVLPETGTAPASGGGGRRRPSLFIPGRSDLWEAFAPKAGLMLAMLLVVGLIGGWFLAGRMLAPLNHITAATRRVGSGTLSHRIRLPGRRDEFRELADAFDGMLALLEARVAEQQRFAANASHELRTPLAITRTLLDVGTKDPNQDTAELLRRLQEVNTRAIDLTEALLVLSRAEQDLFEREPADVSLAAEEATETLLPLAEERGVRIEIAGDVTPTIGSPVLLRQMTTNLVHNAIVHNLPTNGRVWVSSRREVGTVVLTIENTGEELDPDVVATLLEPFRRGSERVHDAHAGVGLGLAIVERVVSAHDGTLSLAARPGGGLVAEVRLPAAPSDVARNL